MLSDKLDWQRVFIDVDQLINFEFNKQGFPAIFIEMCMFLTGMEEHEIMLKKLEQCKPELLEKYEEMLLHEKDAYGRYLDSFSFQEIHQETEDLQTAQLNLG